MTNDYSVGMYSDIDNDVYHSAFGALSEAYEKFVIPTNIKTILSKKNNIRILDICYGVGYNTKALIETTKNLKETKITIDCVDIKKDLILISPFISTHVNIFDRLFYKKNLSNKKNQLKDNIKKMTNIKSVNKTTYKISEKTKHILLKNIIDNFGYNFLDPSLKNYLNKNENCPFFDKDMLNIYKFLNKNETYLHQSKNKTAFVHNIYYKYISKLNKYFKNTHDNTSFKLNFIINDIRTHLINTSYVYDIVMLDGFTPAKCPCIWTIDFFKYLYTKMDTNAVLVTYNTSAPIRNGLLNVGFYVGNTLDKKNKIIGTIASKNIDLIISKLTDKQIGILKTKAGIPYRDLNLSLDNDIILFNRDKEIINSNLITSSQFFKEWKNKYEK